MIALCTKVIISDEVDSEWIYGENLICFKNIKPNVEKIICPSSHLSHLSNKEMKAKRKWQKKKFKKDNFVVDWLLMNHWNTIAEGCKCRPNAYVIHNIDVTFLYRKRSFYAEGRKC